MNHEILEENDDTELIDTEADLQDLDAGVPGFVNYIHQDRTEVRADADPLPTIAATIPNRDALNNE